MKIISLNAYGGKVFGPLVDFVQSQADSTDVFCFQEVLNTSKGSFISNGAMANLFGEFKKILPNFSAFFALAQEHFDQTALVPEDVDAGLATFVSPAYTINKTGEFFICNEPGSFTPGDFGTLPYNLHYVQFVVGGKQLTICNLHGVSQPGDKLDSLDRLAQSQKVLDFVSKQSGEKIIIGDFNLLPNTESIAMFEKAGFKDLIKEFSIKTTRGSLIKKLKPQHGTGSYGWQEFADYVFISSGIQVSNFIVPDLPISDHLPLILEFEM